MNEIDLLKVVGGINKEYVEEAADSAPKEVVDVKAIRGSSGKERSAAGKGGRKMNRKLASAVLVAIIAVVACGSAFAYKEIKKRKSKESLVTETENGKVKLNIPEGITRVTITDGNCGDQIVLDGEDIELFCEQLNSVYGTVEIIPESSGAGYIVNCYRGDEWVAQMSFGETVAKETIDGVNRLITMEERIPAYDYIEQLFEKYRAENK